MAELFRRAAANIATPAALAKLRESLLAERATDRVNITVCGGTGCLAAGAEAVLAAFLDEIEKRELEVQVSLKRTGCHGFCEQGPRVVIRPSDIFYRQVKPEDVPEIVEAVLKGNVVERLLYVDPVTGQKVVHQSDVPFYKGQSRMLLSANEDIDPAEITDYIAAGGYSALAKAIKMSPDQIVGEITRSGLRGRGGGGFPTGRKWLACRAAKGETKYIICNADEGDPGSFQDRSLVEGNPHSILEGMIIGGLAVGAHQGFVYVRNEYPLAIEHMGIAIEQALEYGLLGEKILGSDFDFTVSINRGGGAFVCGESSALMASLEGKVGEPRAKYVHATEKGLWDRPSLLNNVKTWANVPLIINKGAEWYAGIGTERSKGTMIFSLVGKVNNTGLVEVPLGITLRKLIFGIGGGIRGGKKFKAVQTGGPSGGCIPEQFLDAQVDFDELSKLGSMMGSGGVIVMDEDTCMVDVARYFVDFLKEESCGKCVPCREGLKRMSEILGRITRGQGKREDLDTLGEMATVINSTALCALGSSAPNPVMSTLRYFLPEYLAHVDEKRCPAGVCRELVRYSIDSEKCEGCLRCLRDCPTGAITGERRQAHKLNPTLCIRCGACFDVCRFGAIAKH